MSEFYQLRNFSKVIASEAPKPGSTLALIFCVDHFVVQETIEHHLKIGFDHVILFTPTFNKLIANEKVIQFEAEISSRDEAWKIICEHYSKLRRNWIYWGLNGEYLYFPYCETRSIKDLAIFLTEERRNSAFGFIVDAYSRNINQDQHGISFDNTGIDTKNYFSLPAEFDFLEDFEEEERKRFIEIHGGLKWRFIEHTSNDNTKVSSTIFFNLHNDFSIDENGLVIDKEYYSHSCAHHKSPTTAVVSFRTVIDLLHNPNSRAAVRNLNWVGTETFNWSSPQLLRLGFIETGQWF